MTENQCGNANHPRGAWHEATPLPMQTLRNWREVLRYKRNRKQYGCGCEA